MDFITDPKNLMLLFFGKILFLGKLLFFGKPLSHWAFGTQMGQPAGFALTTQLGWKVALGLLRTRWRSSLLWEVQTLLFLGELLGGLSLLERGEFWQENGRSVTQRLSAEVPSAESTDSGVLLTLYICFRIYLQNNSLCYWSKHQK